MMEKEFDEKNATDYFVEQHEKAEKLLKDEDKMERFLQKLEKKFKTIPVAGDALAYVPLMISLVRLYIKKEYTEPPITSLVSIVAALAYVLSPADFISDIIPVVGYSDDALVVAACLALVKTDIEDYRLWRKENGMEITDLPDYEDITKNAEENNKFFSAFFKGRNSKN